MTGPLKLDLDFINDAWERDSALDRTEPAVELTRVPNLHSRYLRALGEARRKKIAVREALKREKTDIRRYYMGLMEAEELAAKNLEQWQTKLLGPALTEKIDSHKSVYDLQLRYEYLDIIIATLESILKELNQRTWQIRGISDWRRFTGDAGPGL